MDYDAEQQQELEALEAIFMDDLVEYTGSTPSAWASNPPVGKTFIMRILPVEEGEEVDGTSQEELEMELLFAHTARYPEEPPCLYLDSVRGLTESEIARCLAHLEQQAQENLGMAMIYTLVSAAKEWLRNRAAQSAEEDPAVAAKRAIAEEEARRQAARAHGTQVTVQSFMQWKAQYDAELALEKAKLLEGVRDDDKSKRITGKAWFLQDRAEVATEAGALSEEDEEDFELDDATPGPDGEEDEEDEDDEDFDLEDEDDDEEDFLEELHAAKAAA